MATKTGTIIRFLVQSKNATRPLPKTMKYFFVFLHVVFALDFGFMKFKARKLNILVKIFTSVQSTVVCLTFASTFLDPSGKSVYTYSTFFLDMLVYYVFTLILVASDYTFQDFQTDLNFFDSEMGVSSATYKIEYRLIIWFSILVVYRCYMNLVYCTVFLEYCEFPSHILLLYYGGLVGFDTVLIVYSYVFYCGYIRLRDFAAFVNKSTDIVSCQYMYKGVAVMIERIKKTFDLVLIFTLVANTTDVTVHVYLPFAKETFKSKNPFDAATAYMVVGQQLIILFSPAFTAGLLANQVENLKLVLFDQLLKREGDVNKDDIKRFVAYIDGRPLSFKVWRVVPLDWRLPVIVVNVAVTYLIVMIQFTHNK